MKIRAFDIKWDTDGCSVPSLKSEMFFEVDADFDADEELADLLSDTTGFCVFGCDYEVVED